MELLVGWLSLTKRVGGWMVGTLFLIWISVGGIVSDRSKRPS
jgi:hypothetical protein